MELNEQEQRMLEQVQQTHQDELMGRDNVVAVGIGEKQVGGKPAGVPAIVVVVSRKLPADQVRPDAVMPTRLGGWPVDVIEGGIPRVPLPEKPQDGQMTPQRLGEKYRKTEWADHRGFETLDIDPTKKWRPIFPGISVGHHAITAGTIGCIVSDRVGRRMILSNNHVLANSNEATQGDAILQPGSYDGGTPDDRVGDLERWVPIEFRDDTGGGDPPCPFMRVIAGLFNVAYVVGKRKTRLRAEKPRPTAADNRVDAAVALIDGSIEAMPEIPMIGKPLPAIAPEINMQVRKYGRTTKLMQGRVSVINATVTVQYGPGQLARFTGQVITSPMSAGGDSGSLIVTAPDQRTGSQAVALLFAGSEQLTIGCPMTEVLELLAVSL